MKTLSRGNRGGNRRPVTHRRESGGRPGFVRRIVAASLPLLLALPALFAPCGEASASISGTTWKPIGPAPIGGFFPGGVSGRATAIAVNPFAGDQVWLGTASGGVWFSPDGGLSWNPMTDGMGALAIGAITLAGCDATGCSKVFAGTGENAIRRDTYYGRGLLVGDLLVPGSPPTYLWQLRTGLPDVDFNLGSINDVVFIPAPIIGIPRLFVTLSSGVTASATESTVTAPPTGSGYGIYSSTDDGVSWTKIAVAGAAGERPTDLELDPSDHDTLYAGFLGVGVFKSEDQGANWCPLSPGIALPAGCVAATGLPDGTATTFDHVEIALFEDDPEVVYATLGHCDDPLIENCLPTLYKSTNGGQTWSLQYDGMPGVDVPYQYSRYTHALTVHPSLGHILWVGGIHLWLSLSDGQFFSKFESNSSPGYKQNGKILHLDHHDVVYDPTNPSRIYDSNDGGFAYTLGGAWYAANDGLQITGFHSITTSPLTNVIIGGTQDNSATMWVGSKVWDSLPCCGDSGFTVIDATNPLVMYALSNFGSVTQSTDGGVSWCNANSGLKAKVNESRAFYAPLVQAASPPHALYWGGEQLYEAAAGNTCNGVLWSPVSPLLGNGQPQPEIYGNEDVITAIAVSESNPNRLYIGYYGGGLFRTDAACDQPSCWTDVGTGLPDAPITRIAVHPTLQDTLLVTLSGFDSGVHVWRSIDGGATWTPSGTGVPNGIPANTIHFEPDSPSVLWLGLDGNPTGDSIYYSSNTGASWVPWSSGLPNVPVYDIALDPSRNRAVAGTHGRGAFMLGGPHLAPRIDPTGVFGRPYDFFWMGWLYPEGGWEECTVELMLEDGTTCASGNTDAQGREIFTDVDGQMMTRGPSGDRAMVWGCFAGTCVGGAPMDDCMQAGNPLSQVAVTCDTETAVADLLMAAPTVNPPGTTFGINFSADPDAATGGSGTGTTMAAAMAGAGRFGLSAVLQEADGSSRSLCSISVPMLPGESNDMLVSRAADLINASAACTGESLGASLVMPAGSNDEDEFPRNSELIAAAPALTGRQLVLAPSAAPGEATDNCYELGALGVPVKDQLQEIALRFTTDPAVGAHGGEVMVTEESPLGACSVAVTTTAGETADEIAASIAAAFDPAAGPTPDCLPAHYPGDATAIGPQVNFVAALHLTACIADPGIGLQILPPGAANLHPTAVVTIPAMTECTGPAGAQVILDGTLSKDPDSSPGTNDDIVLFEWFEDYGLASEVSLGSGDLLPVQLSLGTHLITLKVSDSAGLDDTSTVPVQVVDTTPPVISVSASPNVLWPANHTMITVALAPIVSDACTPDADVVLALVSALSNEADDAPGASDGATINDIQGAVIGDPDVSVGLRAERDGGLSGRIYTLTYSATDASLNVATAPVTVTVPLEVGGVTEPIVITTTATPLGTLLGWTPHPGATAYNVIRVQLDNFMDTGNEYDLGPAVCIEAMSADTDTMGNEDPTDPPLGKAFGFLIESMNGQISGYGTVSALKPRVIVQPDPCAGP